MSLKLTPSGSNNILEIMSSFSASSIPFVMTGSRFFGDVGPDSDYDFFAPNTLETKNFLTSLGFRKLEFCQCYNMETGEVAIRPHPEVPAKGSNIVDVWSKGKIPIHVQLVDNVELKTKIQTVLYNFGIIHSLKFHRISKKDTIVFWNCFYALANIANHKNIDKAELESRFQEAVEKRAHEIAKDIVKGKQVDHIEVNQNLMELLE